MSTVLLFLIQVYLLIRYIAIYIKLYLLFNGKVKIDTLSSVADRPYEEQLNVEQQYRNELLQSYRQIRKKFHCFFIFCISMLLIRIFLYVLLRVDSLGSLSSINVWKDISPAQHYYFYIEETISNIGILWYFFYLAKDVPDH